MEINQFVVVTDDPEFCQGTTLLYIDTRNIRKCVRQQNEDEKNKSHTSIFTNKTLVVGDIIFIQYALKYCELPSNKIENRINLKCNKYVCSIMRPRPIKHFFPVYLTIRMVDFLSLHVAVEIRFFWRTSFFYVMKISVERLRVSNFLTSSFSYLVLTFALFSPFQSSWLVLCDHEQWYIAFKTVGNRGCKFAGDTVLSNVIWICNVAHSETFGGK